jgi:hypothetical protein
MAAVTASGGNGGNGGNDDTDPARAWALYFAMLSERCPGAKCINIHLPRIGGIVRPAFGMALVKTWGASGDVIDRVVQL